MKYCFQVSGMTCAACSARVEKVSRAVPGVLKADVNLLAGTMQMETERPEAVNEVIAAVEKAGYGISSGKDKTVKQPDAPKKEEKQIKLRIVCSFIFLAVLMYFTMGHMIGLPLPGWYAGENNLLVAALVQFLLTLPVVYLNRIYFHRGLKSLWNRAANMDSLIAVGSGAALIYGIFALMRMAYALGNGDLATVTKYGHNLYFESAAMILTLITLGKYLEARAKGKTGDAVRQLMDLSPKTATVIIDGVEQTVSVDAVNVGDIVAVRSGGSIPVDGTVTEGRAAVDQSALTGESVSVEKEVGDTVAASTVVKEGYLQIRADKVGQDTTLAQIIRLVEQAGGSKAPIARLADKIAGIFVPAVMGISAITLVVWLVLGANLETSLNYAISVLVISCPCALGLATPVAVMVGTGVGARMGVLFKNAEALEKLHKIDTVVLDKTGTLTTGKPAVTDVLPNQCSEEALLSVAASLECRSEHPFAQAILAKAEGINFSEPEGFESLPGRGVSAIINGRKYLGGNARLMREYAIAVPDYSDLTAQGKTPLYFACEDGRYLGAVAAADVLKEDSAFAVDQLIKKGLQVYMLTGDNGNTATAIAKAAGVTNVISDVLPADKAAVIQKLRQEGHRVAMVGDGINDAPALVTADIGIALGAGTDIAMESAQIVLMNSTLTGIYNAIALSKATVRNIKQNLFWAFFYNCLGIPVAAGALAFLGLSLNPMIGAAAMSMSSVFVVTNALRLRMFRGKKCDKTEQAITKIQEEITMETVIMVEGMMCPHCKARVESVCKAVPGTKDAVVDLQAKTVTVTGESSVEALKKAIIEAGYEVIG